MPDLLPPRDEDSSDDDDDPEDEDDPEAGNDIEDDDDTNVPSTPTTDNMCPSNITYESLRQAHPPPSSIDSDDIVSAYRHIAHLAAENVDDLAMNTMLQPDETTSDYPIYSLLRDWLIDSGASLHMTNNQADLVLNIEESNAVVRVANGVLIRAELRGTVRVRIEDVHDMQNSCDIYIHDALYVPGLSRRLLSVDQWNAAGGEIWFHPKHTTL
jgi:hypothetical protein